MQAHYENGPEGMPRVERMTDSTIDWVINGVDTNGMYLDEQGHQKLRNVCHAVAEEVLARLPAWPAIASQDTAPPAAVPAPDECPACASTNVRQSHVCRDCGCEYANGVDLDHNAKTARAAAPAQAVDALTDHQIRLMAMTHGVIAFHEDPKLTAFARDVARAALAAQPAAPVEPSAENVRKYRAQGRAEALDIILALCAETGLEDYTEWSANGDAGDHSGNWDERKLRELLHVEDDAYAAFDKAEAAYWEYLGHKDEADRAKAFAENMHSSGRIREVLEKAGEWHLMAQLCWPDAAPVANAGQAQAVAVPGSVRSAAQDLIDVLDGYHEQLVPINRQSATVRALRDALAAAPLPQQVAQTAKFTIGAHVRKTKGSQWSGKVVGTYSTALTPEGYAVESSTEHGSVQIYPGAALELCPEGEPVCCNHNCNQGRDCPLRLPTSRDAYDSMTPERKSALDAELKGLEQRIESHRRSRDRRTHDEPVAEERRHGDRRHAERRDAED